MRHIFFKVVVKLLYLGKKGSVKYIRWMNSNDNDLIPAELITKVVIGDERLIVFMQKTFRGRIDADFMYLQNSGCDNSYHHENCFFAISANKAGKIFKPCFYAISQIRHWHTPERVAIQGETISLKFIAIQLDFAIIQTIDIEFRLNKDINPLKFNIKTFQIA